MQGSIVYTYDMPLKVYGVKGLVIVAGPDGVLVCKKDKAPDLKRLFKSLSAFILEFRKNFIIKKLETIIYKDPKICLTN